MAEATLFSLHLLGPFIAKRHDAGPKPNLSRKTRAIVAYLAATDRAHSRRSLYEMFCAESQDPAGALRWHLSRIRRMIGSNCLLIDGDYVRFNQANGWVDCQKFAQFFSQDESNWATSALNETLSYYRGEFLAELNIQDAANFEFWLLSERSRYRQLFERGLRLAIKRNLAANNFEDAIAQSQRLLQINALSEEGHAFLMQLYAQTGRRETALAQYEHCRQLLATELAVEPSTELTDLYQQIKAGELGNWTRPTLPLLPQNMTAEANGVSLVGRDEQLALLAKAWQASQVVVVSGVAGAGKSALVEAFANSQSQVRLLRGDCYESTTTMPYRPWIDVIEQFIMLFPDHKWDPPQSYWLNQLATISPVLASLSSSEAGIPVRPASQQHLFTALAELLLQTPDLPPLVVFIDDLQWADETSMQLLQFLAQRLRRAGNNPIMLVATFRSEELNDNAMLPVVLRDLGRSAPLLEIELAPLDALQVDELISQLWPDLPLGFRTPHVRDRLLEATAGNPLFLTEILRELAGEGKLPEKVPIPPGLYELVERRMAQLADSGRQVAEAMAILEQPSNLELIQQVSGRTEDEVAEALDMGLRWHLIRSLPEAPAGRYDFTHNLMRSAVNERMSSVRRRLLHRRCALALTRRATAASTIAYHWQKASDREKEAQWWQKAGDEAAKIYAHSDAVRYYQRARALLDEPLPKAEIDWLIATVLVVSSRWTEALTMLDEAETIVRPAKSPKLLGRIRQRKGNIMVHQGRYDEAMSCFNEAQILFEETQSMAEQAEIAGSIGSIHWRRSNYDAALKATEKKLEIAEEIRDSRQQSEALGGTATILTQLGQYEESLMMYEKALQIARQTNDPLRVGKIQGNMGITYARLLNYNKAVDYFRLQFESDSNLGDEAGAANSVGNMGTVYRMFGHFGLSRACAKMRLNVSLSLNDRRGIAVALGNIGASYLDEGAPEQALPILARAVKLAEYLDDPFLLCSYFHFQSQCWYEKGEHEKAADTISRALTMARDVGRLDVLWLAELHNVKFQLAAGLLSESEALDALQKQLEATEDLRIGARLKYELWVLDSSLIQYRDEAIATYRQAFEQTPEHMLRVPLEAMLGETLATSLKLPALPKEIFAKGVPLETLLQEFDTLLPQLLQDK